MSTVSFILALVSAITGLWAAYKWYEASKVDIRPFDESGHEIPTADVRVWINALRGTLDKSGKTNRIAAIWTAVAVASAGLSSVTAAFSK